MRKFCQNTIRKDLTDTTKRLASVRIMVDKMHIAGHVDAWCLENCDSRKIKDLDEVYISCMCIYMYIHIYRDVCANTTYINIHIHVGTYMYVHVQHCDYNHCTCIFTCILLQVDTQICEQTFSWLSRYSKMTRKMKQERFLFFVLYICDLHNRRLQRRLFL